MFFFEKLLEERVGSAREEGTAVSGQTEGREIFFPNEESLGENTGKAGGYIEERF